MPIFEFDCEACQERYDALVRADVRPPCPACGSDQVRKRLSSFASPTGEASGREGLCRPTCEPTPRGPV